MRVSFGHTGMNRETNKTIAVYPAKDDQSLQRLFKGLSEAFPITFVEVDPNRLDSVDAVILLEEDQDILSRVLSWGIRCYLVAEHRSQSIAGLSRQVDFSDHSFLDRRIRGQWLIEEDHELNHCLPAKEGDVVLAAVQSHPLWIRQSCGSCLLDLVAYGPKAVEEDEVLRHHLQGNRFIRLLPLVHFLREITQESDYQSASIQANIHIDDPNLHSMKYGCVDFMEMARHARKHNYHASFAMVPLDTWYANRKTVDLFLNNTRYLSLTMHGNNHTAREFQSVRTEELALQLLAQALRRVHLFEEKYRLHISRIMIPPGEACSELSLRAMRRIGIEGCVQSQAYMWRSHFRLTNIPTIDILTCWWPSELVSDGFPVFRRINLNDSLSTPWHRGEVVISAFLNHPVLLCGGHHYDLKQGLDKIEEASKRVNSLGEVKWCSMTEMAQSSFISRRDDDVLDIRLFCRRATVMIPAGVKTVRIAKRIAYGNYERLIFLAGASPIGDGWSAEVDSTRNGISGIPRVEVMLTQTDSPDPDSIPSPPKRTGIHAVCRRIATETRDRFLPSWAQR